MGWNFMTSRVWFNIGVQEFAPALRQTELAPLRVEFSVNFVSSLHRGASSYLFGGGKPPHSCAFALDPKPIFAWFVSALRVVLPNLSLSSTKTFSNK
jgi:hypothetical protein